MWSVIYTKVCLKLVFSALTNRNSWLSQLFCDFLQILRVELHFASFDNFRHHVLRQQKFEEFNSLLPDCINNTKAIVCTGPSNELTLFVKFFRRIELKIWAFCWASSKRLETSRHVSRCWAQPSTPRAPDCSVRCRDSTMMHTVWWIKVHPAKRSTN